LLCFTPDDVINSIRVTWTTPEERIIFANESRAYNEKNNKKVYKLVDDYIESHPDFAAVALLITNRLSQVSH
jgi:hypothetical protein